MLATADGATVESPQPIRYSAPATAGTALPAWSRKTRRCISTSQGPDGLAWEKQAHPAFPSLIEVIGRRLARGKLSRRPGMLLCIGEKPPWKTFTRALA